MLDKLGGQKNDPTNVRGGTQIKSMKSKPLSSG